MKKIKLVALVLLALFSANLWSATLVEKWQNGKNESTKDLIATFTLGSNASISSSRIQIGSGNTGSFTWTIPAGYAINSIKFVMNSTDDKVGSFSATNGTITNTATKEWTFVPSVSNATSETFTVTASGGAVQISEVWVTFTDGESDTDYESIYPVSADSETPKNVTFTSSSTTSVTSLTTESGVNNKCVQVANGKKVVITASKNIKYILFSWNKYAPSADAEWTANTGSYSKATYKWTPADATTKSVTFTRGASNSAEISNIHIVYYADVPACDDPNATIIADKTDFVNEEIDLQFSSDNTGYLEWDVTLDGNPALGDQDYSWTGAGNFKPLKAGTFVVTATQDADGTYCEVEESVTLTIAEKTPVTAVTIAGPASGIIGSNLVYEATAAGATEFEWYLDGAKQGSDSAKFIYTADPGNHTIFCKARNQFNVDGSSNPTWVESDPIALVAKLNPVIVYWEKTVANRIGIINYGSNVSEGTVKIHTNTDNIDGISLGASYSYADKKFITIKPESGFFEAGDTVFVAVCYNNSAEKTAKVDVFGEDGATKLYTSAANGINGRLVADDPVVEYFVLTSAADSLLIGRNGNTSTFVTTLKVVRPEDNGTPVLTVSATELTLAVTSTEANPTAKVSIYGKNLTPGTYSFGGGSVLGLTITPSSVTVGADGKLKEVITFGYENDNDANPFAAAKSLTIDHASGTKSIQVTLNLSAVHAKDYASSLNIEQWILDNGKNDAAFAAVVAAAKIEFSASNGLDSLQDADKENRNEAFLGLKLKASGITITFWLEKGKALNVKFGNQKNAVNVSIDGVAQTAIAANAGSYALDADAVNDRLIVLTTTDAATVVVKQIMIGEAIADVTLPAQVEFKVTCADAEHGTVKVGTKTSVWIAKGETVTLTLAPESGYKVESVTVNGSPIDAVAGVYSFEMPEANVSVVATFIEDSGTAIDNTEAGVKAVKVIRNGQLFIEKNGVLYNAQGAIVK